MKQIVIFIVLTLSFIAIVILAIIGNMPSWSYFIPAGIGALTLIALFRGLILPARTVSYGLDLIKAQDYNNRLIKVGEPTADHIVTLFNSLIDKLRAERLLNREQESLLKLLIDASPMGVIMLDFNNKVVLVNSSFLKICNFKSAGQIIGKDIREDLREEIISEMLKVNLGDSKIIRKGNFKIYKCYHLNFIQEGFKREFYLLESLTDEIMKAERSAYEKVIRTISHEVNNSIGGVRTVLEIAGNEIVDPEMKKVIESCDNRCEKMCNFIRDYAEVVKLPEPCKKKIDLSSEISEMIPFLRQIIPERIELNFIPATDSNKIEADMVQLQQVVLNIVKNAAESIPGSGIIEIRINNKKEGVKLEISNNGEPICEDIASQLFTPFFTSKPRGKGIGLTFVREVLNRHKADYTLYTDKDGITRFNIIFK